MVLEHVVDSKRVLNHTLFIPVLTFCYTLLALGISLLFFPGLESVALVFCVTLMITPSLMHIMRIEERIESRVGLKHFLRTHTLAFKVYGLAFVGLFVGFLLVSFLFPAGLSFQHDLLEQRGSIGPDVLAEARSGSLSSPDVVVSLATHNLLVLLLCVVLSLFYGAGAVFLVIINASVFASFVSWLVRSSSNTLASLVLLIHFIPELIGFLLASIAGATLSWAFLDQRFGTKKFSNVLKNNMLMLVLAVVFIVVAALLEVYVTLPLLAGMV